MSLRTAGLAAALFSPPLGFSQLLTFSDLTAVIFPSSLLLLNTFGFTWASQTYGLKHLATNRSVAKVILHPQFDTQNYNNDIALVKLSQEVVLSALIRPVCLPKPGVKGHAPVASAQHIGYSGWLGH